MSSNNSITGYTQSYTDKEFKSSYMEQLRNEFLTQKDMILDKNRAFSAETNKRRKELMDKKKAKENEEEQRRQEILEERRARLQDVTLRYQRGQTSKPNSHTPRQHARLIGKRASSAPVVRPSQINLEEALRSIRGNTLYIAADSNSFLQKYGGYKQMSQPNTSTSKVLNAEVVDAQLSAGPENPPTHQFEGRAKDKIPNQTINYSPEKGIDRDSESVASADSLDFEQRSNETKLFNIHSFLTTSFPMQKPDSGSHKPGGGTYRQESPVVLPSNQPKLTPHNDQIRPSENIHSANRIESASSLGFKVVDAQNNLKAADTAVSSKLSDASNYGKSGPSKQNNLAGENETKPYYNPAEAFYLKSRQDSQPKQVSNTFSAWTIKPDDQPTNHIKNHDKPFYTLDNIISNVQMNDTNSTISDTSSEAGGPRSILKKNRDAALSIPRSHSTPNIRDSVEVTKEHMKSTSKPETPKSAKKSVRFSDGNNNERIFLKESSPGINSDGMQINNNNNSNQQIPHISSSITPTPTTRSVMNKQTSAVHKGPVVAKHDILTNPSGKSTQAETNLSEISLDKTPTEDEIEILWNKVRDCLQENTSSSVKSGLPGNSQLQHSNNEALPPKPPIKKITASIINQIPLSTGQRYGSDSGQLLQQRPKQANSLVSPHHSTLGGTSVPLNGVACQEPTKSYTEPNVSSMVNNAPHEVSESMLAYLTAEQLVGHSSVTDQEIIKAMSDSNYRQKLTCNGRPMVPMSALSLEEQRILQSLDRLNNKLKYIEDGQLSTRSQPEYFELHNIPPNFNFTKDAEQLISTLPGTTTMVPRPPYRNNPRSFSATSRGFRGHRPLQSRLRANSADSRNQQNTTSMTTNQHVRLY